MKKFCPPQYKGLKSKFHAFSMLEILIGFMVISVAVLAFTPLITKQLKRNNSKSTDPECYGGIKFVRKLIKVSDMTNGEYRIDIPEDQRLINTFTITLAGAGGGGSGARYYTSDKHYFVYNSVAPGGSYTSHPKHFNPSDKTLYSNYWGSDSYGVYNSPFRPIPASSMAGYNSGYGNDTYDAFVSFIAKKPTLILMGANKYNPDGTINTRGCFSKIELDSTYEFEKSDTSGLKNITLENVKSSHNTSITLGDNTYEVKSVAADPECEKISEDYANFFGSVSGSEGRIIIEVPANRNAMAGQGGGAGGYFREVFDTNEGNNANIKSFCFKIGKGGTAGTAGSGSNNKGGNGGDTSVSIGCTENPTYLMYGGAGGKYVVGSYTTYGGKDCTDQTKMRDDPKMCAGAPGGLAGQISNQNVFANIRNDVGSQPYDGRFGASQTNGYYALGVRKGSGNYSIQGGKGGTIASGNGGAGGCYGLSNADYCTDKEKGEPGEGYGSGGGGGSCSTEKCGAGGAGADGYAIIEYQVTCD